jgi:hypothetical protein
MNEMGDMGYGMMNDEMRIESSPPLLPSLRTPKYIQT